jgi:hypothetical protein
MHKLDLEFLRVKEDLGINGFCERERNKDRELIF